MKRTKLLLAVIALLMFTGAPAFAGGQGEDGAGEGEVQRVVYWSMFNRGEPLMEILDEATQRFNEENPGIEVEVKWQGRQVLTQLRSALAAGEQVDIVDQNHPSVLSSIVYEGLALPMDDYLDSPAYQSDETWRDTFTDGVFDLETSDDRISQVHFIPRDAYSKGFWYDKRMFDELGIEPDVAGMTWSEFLDIIETIEEERPGVSPLGIRGAQNSFTIWWATHAMIREAGLEAWQEAARDETGQMWLENPDFLRGLQRLQALKDAGYFQENYSGYVRMDAQVEWVNAEVAMLFVGAWLPTEMRPQAPDGFTPRMFAWPNVDGGKGNDITEFFANGYVILKDTPNPDAAALYLKSILSERTGQEIADFNTPVPLKNVDQPETHKNQFMMLEQMQHMNQLGGLLRQMPDYVTTVLHEADGAFWGDQIGPEQYLERVAEGTRRYWASK